MPKPSSNSSKLIDTWYYEFEGIAEEGRLAAADVKVEAIKVPIYLRLVKKLDTGTAPPMAVSSVKFELECKEPRFTFTGPDIDALRARMWAELNKNFAVKWENWFLVQITRPSLYDRGIGTGITFSYKRIEKGIAWDKTELMREFHVHSTVKEEITPWPEVFRNQRGDVIACIPATPEHEKGLEEFGASIDALRVKLADYLRPEVIIQNLLAGAGRGLLPPPQQAPRDKSDEQ